MAWSVSEIGDFARASFDVFGLSSFDLCANKLLEGCFGAFGGGLDVFFGGSVHGAVGGREVGALGERDEVFELGLDVTAVAVALVGYSIVTNVALAVDL